MLHGVVAATAVAVLWAPAAQAATVGNPGAVTLTGLSAGAPGAVTGLSLEGFSAAGSADSDGNLLFPIAGMSLPSLDLGTSQSDTITIDSMSATLEPTHDATGAIDPAAGTVSLDARAAAHVTGTGSVLGSSLVVTCDIGDVNDPAELVLSTAPVDPTGLDGALAYDQATGTAKMVGRLSVPTIAADDCELSGSVLAQLADAFKSFFVGTLHDQLDGGAFVLAARFDPALHAPGYVPPAPPTPPDVDAPLPIVPSNVFEVDRLRASRSDGVITLVLDLPGPGAVNAVATADPGKAAAARRITVAHVKRAVKKAGPATLKLKPSKAAKRIVARRGKLRARLRIVYTPTGGSPKAVTRTITLKRAAKR